MSSVYGRMNLLRMGLACALLAPAAYSQTPDKLKLHDVTAKAVTYRGKSAVHLTGPGSAHGLATVVGGPDLQDGAIECDVAGSPAAGASEGARGFIGIAFRVQADASKFELLYLRPTNGRA